MADDQASSQRSDELASALSAVLQNPKDRARWDRVEELLESSERPDDVSKFLHALIEKSLGADLLSEVGQRGVRFYETWYGEDSGELAIWLERVLREDPQAQWAFERLTVAHTVGERWTELLDAYDRAIASADQTARRMRLLDEAAQVAKDFASNAERAIGYMLKLHALDPDNAGLASNLERLLERQERWEDLVGLWKSRLPLQSPKQARDARVRMANCYLDKLGRHADALEQSKLVLAETPDHAAAHDVLERVLADDAAPAPERREALSLLKQRHLDARKPEDVVRVLELGLRYADASERRTLLHELRERLVELGDDARAMRHQAALLALEPTLTERDALRELAERTRDHALYASALIEAADGCAQTGAAAELRMHAARTLEQVLGDERRACELYQRVFESEAPIELVTEAGRRLAPLLEKSGQDQALLAALARTSELETLPAARKPLLGKIAKLAEKLGETARAQAAWEARLAEDAHDLDALEALITGAAEQQAWARLAQLLEQRIAAPGRDGERKKDLVWLAGTYADRLQDLAAAIAVWRRLEQSFGQDLESVQALTELLSRAERWTDLAEVLSQAAARQIARFTELQTRLGDAYRKRLDRPELATERYRSALQVEPRDEAALRGQHELMQDERCRAVAVASLVDAYARTSDWQKTLDLLEARLALEASAQRRSEILIEAARLHENRANDARAALACLRRAFALSPDDRATEKDIRRLAEKLDAWDAVVAAYRETIASFTHETPRMAELRFDEGETLETRVRDAQGAQTAYAEAAALAPERLEFAHAATRVAAELGRWDGAARHAIDCMAARDALEVELLDTLEGVATASKAWDALAEAVTLALRSSALRISPALARELHARVALWHRANRKDEAAAEASLLRAVAADGKHGDTLHALADLQRRTPNEALCDTLLALHALDPENLDTLLEAADLAREAIADAGKRLTIWQRLFDRGADLMRQGSETRGQASAAHATRFALGELASALTAEDPERAYGLLVSAAALGFDVELKREDLHRAARLAATALKDSVRATALYRDLLQSDPLDREAMRELAALYRNADRLPELLMLRRHELSLERSGDRQLELRLDIATLLGEIEARGGRAQALHDNLRARPGHAPTLAALSELFAAQGKHAELAELLRKQAGLLATGEPERAGELLRRGAAIYERELSNPGAAIATYRELFELDPAGEATAALARLHGAQGDHIEAARWLELRLGTVPPDTRAVTAVELGQALLEAGERVRARGCLEQAVQTDPALREARELLAKLYREDSAHEPLAGLLTTAAGLEADPAVQLALLREAASIYCDTLGSPERGLGPLERAAVFAPQDRELQLKLAETFSKAGRHAEARAVFERLIEGFGRKRSPERAELHYRAACAAKAAGDLARAEADLEAATKMDLAHVGAIQMLAELSAEQGELDRAERSYRGLLMLVRRQKPGETVSVGPSEIFFALGSIAASRGQKQQADELSESAMEAATQNDAEARRFQEVLRKRGNVELLMRLLDARMRLSENDLARADVLRARAEALENALGKPAEALEALLEALALSPDDAALHDKTRKLAASRKELDRYLGRLGEIADEAGRKRDAPSQELAARLTLRQGEAIERELSDLDRAAGLYAKVETSGHHVVDAWLAIARVAGARGDQSEQRRVLSSIVEMGGGKVTTEQRREALFALAAIELGSETWRDAGIATLERALEGATEFERAKSVLRTAIEAAPTDAKLSALFVRVARSARDHAMLLEYFERRGKRKEVSFEELREGAELALRINEPARAERLLKRALTSAGSAESDASQATWVYARLCECRKRANDVSGAIAYLGQAVDRAEGEDGDALCRELAKLAASEGGDLDVAASAYARLLERDHEDRSVWQPLLEVYLRMGDRARFESCAEELLRALPLAVDRVAVQFKRAEFLLEVIDDERAAITPLKALLEDEPGHAQATDLLTRIFQKLGMNEELAELLQAHFDRARDEQNLHAIAEMGLRIAELYGERRPETAVDVLRSALSWVPDHAGLLHALLERLGPGGEARERAEVMQSLLKVERGDEAARLALQLAPMWLELEDPDRAQQALELGLVACPDHAGLRDRLESHYAGLEMWRPLGELLEREADRLGNNAEAVARLKNAASLYRDQLQDLDAAAAALRKALAIVPEDLSLLGELARNLAAAGQHRTAIEDVSRLLTNHPQVDTVRADLLKVRAELRLAVEQIADAVADLEEAYALEKATTRTALVDALERLKTAAFTRGETEIERKVVMRLVELHEAGGDRHAARDVLGDWVEQAPEDVDALRALRERDEAGGRWDDVVRTCERLIELESGEARVETTIALADASANAGRPDAARAALERVQREDPRNAELRLRLRALYEAIGAHNELAGILLADAYATKDKGDRVGLFQRAARLYLDAGDAAAALGPLGEATKLQPDDSEIQLLMIDISIQLGKLPQALQSLETAIAAQKRRRSPELALLYQRMARIAALKGDSEEQLKWLNQAVEIDRKSAEIASELAEAAIAAQNWDAAMKALRALTMMDDPRPITRALAFLKQAQIAHLRGDPRRAQHWARKAKELDPNLGEADAFLAEIGG